MAGYSKMTPIEQQVYVAHCEQAIDTFWTQMRESFGAENMAVVVGRYDTLMTAIADEQRISKINNDRVVLDYALMINYLSLVMQMLGEEVDSLQ